MAFVVKVGEAKTRLSELLHRVEAGEEVVLSRGPVAVARLTPVEAGGRRAAALADLLEARAGAGAPVLAHELGLWRALSASPAPAALSPAAPVRAPASAHSAQDGPEAPPGAPERDAAPDASGGFVVAPCFAAAWLLPGPDRRAADAAAAALARGPARALALAAPGLWAGLADLLAAALRRGRLDAGPASAQWRRAGRIPMAEIALADGLDLEAEGEARGQIFALALAQDLAFADAASLAFARARRLPLATNLPALACAARRCGVAVLTDLSDADLR